jgi:hypothetical protein
MRINLAEVDCIFISYDEDNAEQNWADLRNKCMWSERVHGVKGSDACHKAAANISSTDWFITVDADNIVNPAFFDLSVELPDTAVGVTWPALNAINGLHYGNGGLKLWKKDFVLAMRTHENSIDSKHNVEFCWSDGYYSLVDSYSTTFPNASPRQAWRAGFREGVKMTLLDGVKSQAKSATELNKHNLSRLRVWTSVGSHVENGIWTILGARQGLYLAACTSWDYTNVRDFGYLSKLWDDMSHEDPYGLANAYGFKLKDEFSFNSDIMSADVSETFALTAATQYEQLTQQIRWSQVKLSRLA